MSFINFLPWDQEWSCQWDYNDGQTIYLQDLFTLLTPSILLYFFKGHKLVSRRGSSLKV